MPQPSALPAILPPVAHSIDAASTPPVDPVDIAGAFAPNTRRSYASDWKAWEAWCTETGADPLTAPAAAVAIWAKHQVETAGLRVITARRRISAVLQVRRLAGRPIDRADPALTFAMARLAREYGTAVRGKAALMTADVEALLAAAAGDSLTAIRDRALLLIHFAGAFRRSELAALQLADIDWRRDGIIVHVIRSKGDQAGAGQDVPIRYGAKERTCPIRALKRWLESAGIKDGPAFRRILNGQLTDAALSGAAINDMVKRRAAQAGLEVEHLGSHSLRAGHITQSLENGAEPLAAMNQARHKRLETTLSYNRRAAALKDSSSGKLGL